MHETSELKKTVSNSLIMAELSSKTKVLVAAGFCLIPLYGVIKRSLIRVPRSDRALGSADFEAAAAYFGRNPDRFTADLQLELYALFKQSTVGDAPADAMELVSVLDPKRRVMNEAWLHKRGMSADAAQEAYVSIVSSRCPKWRTGTCNEKDEDAGRSGWAVGSVPMEALGTGDSDASVVGQLCELAAEGDFAAVEEVVSKDPSIVLSADKDGMTCLHWASDRGHTEMVRFLLDKGSAVNAQDHCGNTPLHIAVMAGQKETVRLLIDSKADMTVTNSEGESAAGLIKTEFPKLILA